MSSANRRVTGNPSLNMHALKLTLVRAITSPMGEPVPLHDGDPGSAESSNPRRFYGSVEIDMVRPVKSFDTILNAVMMELQRTQGAKVRLTLEIEAEALGGFADGEVSVVRDNARQLKFQAESTGFEE